MRDSSKGVSKRARRTGADDVAADGACAAEDEDGGGGRWCWHGGDVGGVWQAVGSVGVVRVLLIVLTVSSVILSGETGCHRLWQTDCCLVYGFLVDGLLRGKGDLGKRAAAW